MPIQNLPSNSLTGFTTADGYDESADGRRVVAFVVENTPDARPQWGMDDENYSPTEIRRILINAITRIYHKYGFNKWEDSTRVITIKRVNHFRSFIEYSCDFAIVYRNQYIRLNKKTQEYIWAYQAKGYEHLEERAEMLKRDKNKKYWNKVRDTYIYKKNNNNDPDKHSRSLYAETINEVYRWYLNDKKQ